MVSAPTTAFSVNGARPFVLRPDWNGRVQQRDVVDVNLGHTPESFVRAAHAQLTGQAAPDALVRRWAQELRANPRFRRIDLVRLLAKESSRSCELCFGDPWQAHPELLGAPERGTRRQVGAVLVSEPGPTNGSSRALDQDFKRELLDAKWAGLDFLLLAATEPALPIGQPQALVQALAELNEPIKLGLFDRADGNTDASAVYDQKWRPFFRQVDRQHWYRFKGKPLLYFDGTRSSSEHLAQLKRAFEQELGESPFLCVAGAHIDDGLADARFEWFTFDLPEKRSRSTSNGHIVDHAMVRWDSVERERPGELAAPTDLLVKGSELLEQVLHDSRDAELLVLATWNDQGDGTGIHRNFDYWVNGSWLSPEHFMRKIRVSQSTESFKSTRRSTNVIG